MTKLYIIAVLLLAAPLWMSVLVCWLPARPRHRLLLTLMALAGMSWIFFVPRADDDRYLYTGPLPLMVSLWLLLSYGVGRFILSCRGKPEGPPAPSMLEAKVRLAWGLFSYIAAVLFVAELLVPMFGNWRSQGGCAPYLIFLAIWWGIWSLQVAGPLRSFRFCEMTAMAESSPPTEEQPRWALGFFCAGLIGLSLILFFVPGWRWISGLILLVFWIAIAWRFQRGYSICVLFRRDSWR